MRRPIRFSSFLLLFVSLATVKCLAANPPVRIMPLGDSITWGFSPDTTVQGGYRMKLYILLTNAGYNVNFVGTQSDTNPPAALPEPNHEGHRPYFEINQIDAGIDTWLAQVDDPDVVLLLIGTNDFNQGYDTTHATNRLENLIANIATARPYAKIIVANLLLETFDPNVDNAIQTLYNAYIPGVVAHQISLGRQVSFVDLRNCCGASDLSSDGVHPSLVGYDKVGQAWFPAVTNVIGPLGTTNPPAIAHLVGQIDLKHVLVTFSKPIQDTSINPANFGLSGGLSISQASLDSTKRVITLTTSPQATNTSYTLTVSGVQDRILPANVIAPGSTASFQSGAVTEAVNYSLVYSLKVPSHVDYGTVPVAYDVDNHASVGAFSRLAYYLEVQPIGGSTQYVWVSMDAFTTDASKIGVPTIQSGGFFQRLVSNMNVRSSVAGIVNGDRIGTGNMEFWWGDYFQTNAANVPGASSTFYDFGDRASASDPAGYGSMQVHNYGAGQTLFAFNGWWGGQTCDLGIGNCPVSSGSNPDWTFAQNATNYGPKKLQVYVLSSVHTLTVHSTNPSSGVNVTASPADNSGSSSGSSPFSLSYPDGTSVTLRAPLTTASTTFLKWQQDGSDLAVTTNVTVTMSADHTLTAVYVPTRALTVHSSNPASGLNVAASPADNSGSSSGSSPFGLSYPDGTAVTLRAPLTTASTTFQKWQQDGSDLAVTTNVTVTMSAGHTLTAVYVPTRVLTVHSSNPASGLNVTASPADNSGSSSGSSPFSLSYPDGTSVTLRAPLTTASTTFQKWQQDGSDLAVTTNVTVTMSAGHTLTAVYVPTRALTVHSSNPASGLNVTASPADNNGSSSGSSPYSLSYADGTAVTLRAPLTTASTTFQKWQQDGSDLAVTTNVTVTMSADHTLTAVYVPTRVLTVHSTNPNSGLSVTASPADNNGSNSGSSPYSLSYPDRTSVTLRAPLTTASTTFQKWQQDGSDLAVTTNVTVTMNSDHTATAVYSSTVLQAIIFYNNSVWDGNDPSANSNDDHAIALDKLPLRRSQIANFSNYTSYGKGINGIMMDVSSVPGALTTNDFTFKVGNDNNPSGWTDAPLPTTLALRSGAGTNGSERVTLIWPDNAIEKQWLEVTVLATANTSLASPCVFYFGNAIGETGDVEGNANVLVNDALRILNHMTLGVTVTNPYDIDRDGNVLVNDALVCLNNLMAGSRALQWIDLSGLAPTGLNEALKTAAPDQLSLASLPAAGAADSASQGFHTDSRQLFVGLNEDGHLVLDLSASVGQSYRLQSCDSLGTEPWRDSDLPESILPGNVRRWVLPIEIGTPQRFYRVLQSPNAVQNSVGQ